MDLAASGPVNEQWQHIRRHGEFWSMIFSFYSVLFVLNHHHCCLYVLISYHIVMFFAKLYEVFCMIAGQLHISFW